MSTLDPKDGQDRTTCSYPNPLPRQSSSATPTPTKGHPKLTTSLSSSPSTYRQSKRQLRKGKIGEKLTGKNSQRRYNTNSATTRRQPQSWIGRPSTKKSTNWKTPSQQRSKKRSHEL